MLVNLSVGEIKKLKSKESVVESYKTVDGLNLPIKVCYPEDRSKKSAAVVCIHGGSWKAVTDNSPWEGGWMGPQAEYFAARGAVGITISYRSFYLPDEEKDKQHPTLWDLYEDCRDAIGYIRKNAYRFGIDTERIAVIGDSAGGHLSACLALIGNDDPETKVNGAILCNPITDLFDPAWIKYAGGNESEEYIRSISPLYNAENADIPILIMHGTADKCVLPSHSERLYEEICKTGVNCKLELFTGADHAFILIGYTATDEQICKAMKAADEFLVDIGYII